MRPSGKSTRLKGRWILRRPRFSLLDRAIMPQVALPRAAAPRHRERSDGVRTNGPPRNAAAGQPLRPHLGPAYRNPPAVVGTLEPDVLARHLYYLSGTSLQASPRRPLDPRPGQDLPQMTSFPGKPGDLNTPAEPGPGRWPPGCGRSDHGPAFLCSYPDVQGAVEPDLGPRYFGVWADRTSTEEDHAAGPMAAVRSSRW